MMRKLDQRGVAALEFCIIAVPLFFLMFAIFDLGRYAITRQSLQALANVGARKMMIKCYTPAAIANTSPSGCTDINTYFPDPERQAIAPFLYRGDLTATLQVASGAGALTVTASQPGFSMLIPWWPTAFNATASASTSVPF
jgi:Flp pilus assembly protein TadG